MHVLLALAALCAATTAVAQEATLIGDAHVSSARPTVNAGTLSNLDVGGEYTALVQFDLSQLPPGTTPAQITRATLRLYCNRADTPGAVSLQTVGGPWIELGVTYATLPTLGAVVQTAQVPAAGTYITFDITVAVQAWLSGATSNNGLAIAGSGTTQVQFDSKENDQTGHAPELDIALAAGGAGSVGATGATGAAGATGPQGNPGPQGPIGPAGATGAPGTNGAPGMPGLNGATGATGAVGPAGPAGSGGGGAIQYQGTYSSTTNYALGDIVQWSGSSWVSLQASNAGNTPGLVPGEWGLLASVGATGAVGATGSPGATGPQGPEGFGQQGAAGSTGATGATGAQGLAGLAYQGTYSSTTNYNLGDVVIFQGSSYASLVTFNVGQTPGLSPTYWGPLTAQGPIGLTGATGDPGPTGATGALGPVGPPGERGNTGAQGVAGEAGGQGIPGVTGATGLQGPMGPQGDAGPVGMSFQGPYDSTLNYGIGDGVTWQGAGWVSLVASNHGNTPSLSPQQWALFATGTAGATGATGPPGTAGLNGLDGAVGPTGATGITGATGTAGTPGLVYQGAYNSATNYILGDVVVWQGASWVSLAGFNVGQTPDQSPGYWGVLTSVGPQGPAGSTGSIGPIGPEGMPGLVGPPGPQGVGGPIGIQGPAGAQGLTGVTGAQGSPGPQGLQGLPGEAGAQGIPGTTGATGLQGPLGETGPAGPVGMTFQGPYSAGTNYAVGDGVTWQGSGWVSVITENHGNTPSLSPTAWQQFSAPGATGAQGLPGPQGLQGLAGTNGAPGAIGPAGAIGPQGQQGVVGPPGPQGTAGPIGIQGPAGAQGLTGPTGAQGSAGPQGLQGTPGQAGQQGIPGTTGATGLQGPAGPTGTPGATGATGAAGTNGLDGTPGVQWQGAWTSATNYALHDTVSYAGTSYLSITTSNVAQRPDLYPASWAILAQAGTAGATGAPGATGTAGAAGPAGPQGVAGPAGAKGAAGAPGINFRGAWNAQTNYNVNDGVTFAGSTYLAQEAGSNQEPDVNTQSWAVLAQSGGVGPAGATGASATVTIGTVTTLPAGATATVSNSGTSQAAVLNFGIPQGAAGTGGGSGTGTASGTFAAMYHPVSFNTLYYAVNSPNASATEASGAVLAWVPQGCTATRLDVYSQQSGAITVTLRSGTPGSLTDTTLACSPATNGSCSATGSVPVAAGNFLDLRIDLASGTTAGVWTSLQCQ